MCHQSAARAAIAAAKTTSAAGALLSPPLLLLVTLLNNTRRKAFNFQAGHGCHQRSMQLSRFVRPLLPLFPLLLRVSSALMLLPLALSTLLAVLLQIFIGTVLMGLQLCEGSVVMLVALIMPHPELVRLSILHD